MSAATRTRDIEPFLAVEVAERAQALERDGADVVNFHYGEPDFEAPAPVLEALARAIKDGRTKYASSLGILPLREAIAEHYGVRYGVSVGPDQVLVTPGTSPAMLLLFGHLLDPGDEVILSNPFYACYPNFIRYAGGVPVEVPLEAVDGWQFAADAVRARVGAGTRAILVNSPANPTGAVLAAHRLRALADLGVPVVADEIYHGLNYAGRDHSILEFTDRAVVLNGFSKAFAMTGWRLGYVIAPRETIRALGMLFGNFFISTAEFVQWAGVAALREAADETARYRAIFDERRRAMIDGVRAVGLRVDVEPTGAFYVLADARHHASDSRRLASEILETCHVALTPGVAFGKKAEGYLRFSYASSIERIREGLVRLERFFAARTGTSR
jgi:aspartate/methionine/tyrosine aminotransferase